MGTYKNVDPNGDLDELVRVTVAAAPPFSLKTETLLASILGPANQAYLARTATEDASREKPG